MSKKKTTLAKASNKKATKTTNKGVKKMTKPDFMKKFEMTPNMVIGSRDAKIWVYGSLRAIKAQPEVKAIKAVKAVKAVPAIKAVKEKKDKDGKIIQKAVVAAPVIKEVKKVKEVKAVLAIEAKSQKWTGYAIGNTVKIISELIARLGDQGFYPDAEYTIHPNNDKKFSAHYTVEDVKGFRAALKLCKNPGKYNDPGLKVLAEKEKAEKEAEKKAKKEAKSEPVKSINGSDQKKKIAEAKAKKEKDEGADWPTS